MAKYGGVSIDEQECIVRFDAKTGKAFINSTWPKASTRSQPYQARNRSAGALTTKEERMSGTRRDLTPEQQLKDVAFGGCLGDLKREKYWGELDADGKLERLREQVKKAQQEIAGLRNLVERVLNHGHANIQGQQLIVPFLDSLVGREVFRSPAMDSEIYF